MRSMRSNRNSTRAAPTDIPNSFRATPPGNRNGIDRSGRDSSTGTKTRRGGFATSWLSFMARIRRERFAAPRRSRSASTVAAPTPRNSRSCSRSLANDAPMKAGGVPTGLKFEIAPSYDALSRRAADVIVAELKQKPDLLLCASAGGTPTGTYERLAHQARSQPRLFGNMRVLQIDEWGGLDPGHPATCEADLRTKLLDPLRIGKDRYFGFKTDTADPAAQCARMARWLSRNGPVDLCILGLGLNGHIAMNEPGESLAPHTHVAQLAPGSL